MNLEEIKQAVDSGKTVHWASDLYVVVHDSAGQWLIECTANGSCIGLTWADGVTLNGNESQFYIKESDGPRTH